jgi:hypothetical protein
VSRFEVTPCTRRLGGDAPGVILMKAREALGRLSPDEARSLGAGLIVAADASEAQWDAPGLENAALAAASVAAVTPAGEDQAVASA